MNGCYDCTRDVPALVWGKASCVSRVSRQADSVLHGMLPGSDLLVAGYRSLLQGYH